MIMSSFGGEFEGLDKLNPFIDGLFRFIGGIASSEVKLILPDRFAK